MADASLGILGRMGIVTGAATWETVSFPGSATTIPFLTETLTPQFNRIEQDSLVGFGGRLPSDQGVEVITGTTEHIMDYTTMHVLLTAVLGDDAAGTITIEDRHGDGSAKAFWIEIDKEHVEYVFGPGKPTKITISGEKDGKITISLDWVFFGFQSKSSGFTGGAWTPTPRMLFEHGIFRVADQVDALQASDEINPDSFEITFDRGMKTDDYVADTTYPKQTLIPIENDFRSAQYKVALPRFESDTFGTWKNADTALQGDIVFTLSGNTLTISMPELRITEGFDASIDGPAALKLDGTFDLYRCGNGSHPMGTGNEIEIVYT